MYLPMIVRISCAAVLAVTTLGCAGEEGELGQVNYVYMCTEEENDAACDEEGGNAVYSGFPEVAVGGRFQVGFQGLHDTVIANEAFLLPQGDDLVAQRAGVCAVIALDVRNLDGRGEDVMHVRIRDIDSLALMRGTSGSTVFQPIGSEGLLLTEDETVLLRAVPQADGEVLAGGLDYEWSCSDSQVLQLQAPTTGNKATVVAVGQGTAMITVEHEGIVAQLAVEVSP